MTDWIRISEVPAPKDGTIIQLGWAHDGEGKIQENYTMKWSDSQTNFLFPNVTGMWVTPCGGATWNDNDPDGAPTHWKPISE